MKGISRTPMFTDERVKWWALRQEWERKQGTKEAEITTVKISNQYGKQIKKLRCGDNIGIKVGFVVLEEIQEAHFGVAIFREDGVYCYGPNTLFDGYRVDKLNRGKGWFSIEYKNLNLMPGDYRFSVAIWDKKEVLAHTYHPGFYKFKVTGFNSTGELLHLAHRWKPSKRRSLFKSSHLTKNFSLSTLDGRWKEIYNAKDIEVSSVEFLDKDNNLKEIFRTGERVEVKVQLKINRELKDDYLWVGIFRKDGVYCHGVLRKLSKALESVSIIYPKLQLLTGEYRISIGVWQSEQNEFLTLHHGVYPLKVVFDRRDHGTVYLEHRWRWRLKASGVK